MNHGKIFKIVFIKTKENIMFLVDGFEDGYVTLLSHICRSKQMSQSNLSESTESYNSFKTIRNLVTIFPKQHLVYSLLLINNKYFCSNFIIASYKSY